MTYSEAIEYKNNNAGLIGTSTERGLKIGKIIIVPSNEYERERFFSSFLLSNDDESAIVPFIKGPVEVWAIDLEYLNRNNVLFYKKLA